jgi:hypothetical protein
MDNEQPYSMNVGGKSIEIWEHKYGFVPGQEQITSRSRRRFRLGGKNPNDVAASLWLLFYSRTGDETRVVANPMQARPQPIRKYPLPNVTTKPFNLFQAVTGAAQMPSHQQQLQQQQYQMQQMQAQQSQAAALQAQQQSQQSTPRQMSQRPPYPTHQSQQGYNSQHATPAQVIPQKRAHASQTPATPASHLPAEAVARMQRGEVLADGVVGFEEPVGDELDAVHPIDISRSRFIRHQDWMEEIFSAYPITRITAPSGKPDDLTEEMLKAQIAKNEAEVQSMKAAHEAALNKIRHPEGLQGRMKVALDIFENDNGQLTAESLEALEKEVGLNTLPWTAQKVPISSSSS